MPAQYASDEELCPDYAAMREFYELLIACRRNNGMRTCRSFRCSLERIEVMTRIARREGFEVQAASIGMPATLSVEIKPAAAAATPGKTVPSDLLEKGSE